MLPSSFQGLLLTLTTGYYGLHEPTYLPTSDGRGKDGKGKKRRNPRSEPKEKEPSFGPPGCNLFVFHLPDDWTDEDLLEYFAPHGTVTWQGVKGWSVPSSALAPSSKALVSTSFLLVLVRHLLLVAMHLLLLASNLVASC